METGSQARLDYSRIKKEYIANGKGNIRLTQSTLTLIQDINPTKTQYTFPVLENDNATGIKPEEIRLNNNDEFIVTSLGVYLLGKLLNERVQVGGYLYFTHVPTYQAIASTTAQPLYDGYLRIGVNNINYLDKFDLRKFENVEKTQWNNSGAINKTGATLPSTTLEADNMYEISPNLTLSGAKKNDITIVLPYALNGFLVSLVNNVGETQTFQVSAIGMEFRGMLAQNGAVFQTGSKR